MLKSPVTLQGSQYGLGRVAGGVADLKLRLMVGILKHRAARILEKRERQVQRFDMAEGQGSAKQEARGVSR